MGTVYDAISFIRETAISERDKGTKFERLTRFFLKNDPLWQSRLSEVWMWGNAPTNDGADIGIDLVAQDRRDGSYDTPLADTEIDMRINMGGGLPVAGFYEMKQEVYEIARRIKKAGNDNS